MNWEAVGAIGELVGAAGVIATLVFLAFQIRQNSKLLRTNTTQLEQNRDLAIAEAIGQSNSQEAAMLALAQNAELSAIFYSGLADFNQLNGQEKLRFASVLGPLIGGVATQWERQLHLSQEMQEIAPNHLLFALAYLATPGGSEWWSQYRLMYPRRFRESIDHELARKGLVVENT